METVNQPGAGSTSPDPLHERHVGYLRTLRRTLSMVTMYGLDHAVPRAQVEESYQELTRLLRVGKRLDITAFEENLLLNGKPASATDPYVNELARLLERLELPGLEFLPGVASQEYEELLAVLAQRNGPDLGAAVDAATALRSKRLPHIRVQVSQYRRVAEDQAVVDRTLGVNPSTHPGRSSHPASRKSAGRDQDVEEWERAWKQQMQQNWDLSAGPDAAPESKPAAVPARGAEGVRERMAKVAGAMQESVRTIAASIGFLLKESTGPLNHQQHELLESARDSLERAGRLLEEMEKLAN